MKLLQTGRKNLLKPYLVIELMPEEGLLKKFYRDYRLVAVLPAVCVIIDYALTFAFADDSSMILSWEASPLVRFALINDILIPYLASIVLFYFVASYAVLRIIAGTEYYRFGVLLIVTMSITHLVGGMSWHFRNTMYSNGVFMMSALSVVIAFVIFGFSLLHEHEKVRSPQ